MKKIRNYGLSYCIYTALFVVLLVSCKREDNYNIITSTDKTKPGPVTNVKVVNTPGGANISYDLPKSSNILYVQANYKINDKTEQVKKTSYVLDSMRLKGFAESKDYTVTLTVVSQAEVASDPVTVTVHPETPPYLVAGSQASLTPDFGGTFMRSVNIDTSEALKYVILVNDPSSQTLKPFYQAATKDSVLKYNVRGMAAVPTQFGVYFSDLYGNVSDTTLVTLTPIPEIKLDRSLFREYPLNSDNYSGGWPVSNLWDDDYSTNWGESSWRGVPNGPLTFPICATFDMGVSAKLSRFIYWPRLEVWPWQNENQQNFAIWGSNVINPADAKPPLKANVGDINGDWECLGTFQPPPKPSGSPYGVTTAADRAFAEAGWEYYFPAGAKKYRYLRYVALDNYSNTGGAIVTELTIYGNPN